METRERSRNYGLDVLRAGAIGGVLMAHAVAVIASGAGITLPGWTDWPGVIGVEVFFVLSGFLIGNILIEVAQIGASPRQWLIFMVRRWMRTLPLYFVLIGLQLVAIPPSRDILGHAISYFTLTQNFAAPMRDDWFGVTWSLAVEEWFYLLFSAAFLTAAALWGRTGRYAVIALFLLLPLLGRLLVPVDAPWDAAIRKVVLLRLDAIAAGVVLAEIAASARGLSSLPLHGWLAGVPMVLLAVHSANLEFVWARALGFTAMSLGIALCFPIALTWRKGTLARPILITSSISYGLYLMHIPALVFLRWHLHVPDGPLMVAFTAVAGVAGAWLSFVLFETPILRMRPRQAGTSNKAPAAAAHGVP